MVPAFEQPVFPLLHGQYISQTTLVILYLMSSQSIASLLRQVISRACKISWIPWSELWSDSVMNKVTCLCYPGGINTQQGLVAAIWSTCVLWEGAALIIRSPKPGTGRRITAILLPFWQLMHKLLFWLGYLGLTWITGGIQGKTILTVVIAQLITWDLIFNWCQPAQAHWGSLKMLTGSSWATEGCRTRETTSCRKCHVNIPSCFHAPVVNIVERNQCYKIKATLACCALCMYFISSENQKLLGLLTLLTEDIWILSVRLQHIA